MRVGMLLSMLRACPQVDKSLTWRLNVWVTQGRKRKHILHWHCGQQRRPASIHLLLGHRWPVGDVTGLLHNLAHVASPVEHLPKPYGQRHAMLTCCRLVFPSITLPAAPLQPWKAGEPRPRYGVGCTRRCAPRLRFPSVGNLAHNIFKARANQSDVKATACICSHQQELPGDDLRPVWWNFRRVQ